MEKKEPYNIKIFNGSSWDYLGTEYLNPHDDDKKKDKEIERIKKKYNVSGYLNISNFFDIYN